MVKINVLLITYKQQNVIGRAIDSLLCQKEYGLNKIIICDDCSPDDNWSMIREYQTKYPEIITAYRNEVNLGIYGNFNKLLTLKGEADLYNFMAGDDILCDGWFKNIQTFIEKENIDVSGQVGLFSDWENIYPDGRNQIFRINSVFRNHKYRTFGLHLRDLASTRSMLVSKAVVDRMEQVDTTKGIGFSETLFNMGCSYNIQQAYYMPFVGSGYYCGIGVSANLYEYDPEYFTDGNIVACNVLREKYVNDKKDEFWLRYKIEFSKNMKEKSFNHAMKSLAFFLLSSIGYPRTIRRFASLCKSLLCC